MQLQTKAEKFEIIDKYKYLLRKLGSKAPPDYLRK